MSVANPHMKQLKIANMGRLVVTGLSGFSLCFACLDGLTPKGVKLMLHVL